MYKDNYHDYVVGAMRCYALCGCPSEEELMRRRSVLPEEKYYDLMAVERMLYRLGREEYGHLGVRCVETVYLSSPSEILSHGEITRRVVFASREAYICETSVYKALRRARALVAMERGLRIDDTLV